MRRLIICACVLAATAAAPQAATAQPRVELRSTPPAGLQAGKTWHANLFVHGTAGELAASAPPTILIHNDAAGWTEIRATRVPGHLGAYTAAVVFPSGGTWTYHVHDPIAGGGYDFDPIVVAAASKPGDGLPLWVLVGATLGIPLVAAAAMIARLRRRPQIA
jgi:hypothetical protein